MPVYSSNQLPKTHPKRNKFVFLGLWTVGHMLAWVVYYSLMASFPNYALGDWYWISMMSLTLGSVTSLAQYLLIRWQFGKNIKWWIPVSIVTWLLAGLFPFQASLDLGYSQFDVTIQAIALFAPAAFVQTFMLRKYIRQSWLWLLATMAGTTIFALSVTAFDWLEWSVFAGYGLQASVTAMTLLWLFGMSGTQMQEAAEDRSYYRLVDSDYSEYDDHEYEQELQRRKRLSGE